MAYIGTRSSGRPVPGERVPAGRRWLGIERRTIVPAVSVLALAVIFAVVLPAVNSAVPHHDVVKAGDVMQLADGVRFTPTPGWGIVSGVRAGDGGRSRGYPAKAVVEKDGYTLTARVSAYRGTAASLLERQRAARNRAGTGAPITGRGVAMTTATGLDAEVARPTGGGSGGTLATVVADGVGIEITATGARGADDGQGARDVARMIRSVRVVAVS